MHKGGAGCRMHGVLAGFVRGGGRKVEYRCLADTHLLSGRPSHRLKARIGSVASPPRPRCRTGSTPAERDFPVCRMASCPAQVEALWLAAIEVGAV